MTPEKWLEQFKTNQEKLTNFVSHWCPGARDYGCENVDLPITAPVPESARKSLMKGLQTPNLKNRWEMAIEANDISILYTFLNRAWMGVPESTSCWRLEGFREAVALLEDPPEYDEPPDEVV